MSLGRSGVVRPPGVGAEDGHPAQEEEDHDDDEHADHALLGYQVGGGTAAPDAVDSAAAVAARQLLKLQLLRVPGLLQVTAITVLIAAAAAAQLLLCRGKRHPFIARDMPCQREDVKTLTPSVQEAKLNLNWRSGQAACPALVYISIGLR